MRSCMVVGCTSGCRSNSEKFHMFTIPKDPEKFKLWTNAIKRFDVKPGQSVCQNHFFPEQVVWKRLLLGPDGTELGVSYYKIPRLKPNSVPSIFPWTESVTPPPNASSENTKIVDHFIDPNDGRFENVVKTSLQDPTVQSPIDPLQLQPIITFQKLAEIHTSMIPDGWTKLMITCGDMEILRFSIEKCIKIDDILRTFLLKEVIVKPDLSLQICVVGQPLNESNVNIDWGPIETVEKLQEILAVINQRKICTGIKESKDPNVKLNNSVHKDVIGIQRHIRCYLLLSVGSVCLFCRRARRTLTTMIRRAKKGDSPKRIFMSGSSKPESVISNLRAKYHTALKATRYARNTVTKLKFRLEKCHKKLKAYDAKNLSEHIKNEKIVENQAQDIKKILAAAKCKDPKGNRYSEEWRLMCLVLHMRSPAGYNFLRTNHILPLPCVRTVQRYLSKIGTTRDFDARFLEILKSAFEKKQESQKHGSLIPDEIDEQEL